jgi:hypothetical protein
MLALHLDEQIEACLIILVISMMGSDGTVQEYIALQ